ncbi:VacJ (modular protein) [Desulfamplus magnetovallimortis]|uniref:VacJ (Modular protein) n=1 Tax=Desulfamplus magnetovallimortis TaxID=1246637 RepID=A0A1W1HDN2_9BACT|nr:VacJ family lipoprotein [Desulfamplus magnetovallimortis]SLM30485.1 VacJ (modular protein) [Desulfamplus magnetovallimortis]
MRLFITSEGLLESLRNILIYNYYNVFVVMRQKIWGGIRKFPYFKVLLDFYTSLWQMVLPWLFIIKFLSFEAVTGFYTLLCLPKHGGGGENLGKGISLIGKGSFLKKLLVCFFIVSILPVNFILSSENSWKIEIKHAVAMAVEDSTNVNEDIESSKDSKAIEYEDMGVMDELFEYDEPETSEKDDFVADPLHTVNRALFYFNDKFYFYLLKPVALGYQKVTPLFLRKGVANFFNNTLFPLRFVNNILQAKFTRAMTEGKIFFINTVAGGLGFATPAQDYFELKNYPEDLGQTLGSYSIGEGFYVVLPLLGPSTLRDLVGTAGDYFLKPVTYVEPAELAIGVSTLNTVNATTFRIGDYEALKKAALDPYVALKDAYIQMRRKKVEE